MRSHAELRDIAVTAVEAARDAFRVHWSAGMQVLHRAAGDKEIDRRVESAVVSFLEGVTPGIPVVGGEAGGAIDGRTWLLDPIDGTVNLLRGSPYVGISVGLLDDGVPTVGAVGALLHDGMWSAAVGLGSHDQNGRALSVQCDRGPTRVTSTGPPGAGSPSIDRWRSTIAAVLDDGSDVRRCGAACLDLAFAASGVVDGHLELGGLVAGGGLDSLALGPWDVAAGALLVREAGGRVTDWEGDERAVYETGSIVAGAPEWHEWALDIIRAVDARARGAP
jgi:myo-inositol-1(or 4)-monophosphatase